MVQKFADVGIALDGDADRVILIDEKGQVVDGDAVMALCATLMLKSKTLVKNTLVTTVMSNLGLDFAIQKAGGKVLRTQVGDRYVVEEMRRQGYMLGGEQSGHMIFLEHNTTGDGVVSALQVLAIMQETGKSLSELAEVMTALPQVLVNVRVRERKDVSTIPAVQGLIDKVTAQLGDEGRVLIRYSGTEPLLRIMLEGRDQDEITAMAEEIAAEVKKEIGESEAGG